MIVGYARTSTVDQTYGLEAQIEQLQQGGCEKVFTEQVSSISGRREQLEAALDFVREGDVLMVTKLDRLCRNVSELCRIVAGLEEKQVSLRILSIALDTATAAGKLMLNLLGAVAEFETAIMKERQREGIERAKRDGKYKGRKATARAKTAEVQQLRSEGLGASAIASQLGISRASVYRMLG